LELHWNCIGYVREIDSGRAVNAPGVIDGRGFLARAEQILVPTLNI